LDPTGSPSHIFIKLALISPLSFPAEMMMDKAAEEVPNEVELSKTLKARMARDAAGDPAADANYDYGTGD
jgi:hypothetical protein